MYNSDMSHAIQVALRTAAIQSLVFVALFAAAVFGWFGDMRRDRTLYLEMLLLWTISIFAFTAVDVCLRSFFRTSTCPTRALERVQQFVWSQGVYSPQAEHRATADHPSE